MDSATSGTPKRLLRLLIAAGFLAAGWVAVDLVVHSEPAAAADILPAAGEYDNPVSVLLDSTSATLGEVVAETMQTVAPVASPIVVDVVAPAVETVVTPVVTPVVEAIVTPVVAPVIAPIATAVVDLITPLAPFVEPILSPVLPPAAAVLDALDNAAVASELLPALTATTPNAAILAVGGSMLLGTVLAVSAAPLLPAPSNGGPLSVPLAPAAPTGSSGSSSAAMYGELNSGVLAGVGASGTAGADVDGLPSSPTFASDTTPD